MLRHWCSVCALALLVTLIPSQAVELSSSQSLLDQYCNSSTNASEIRTCQLVEQTNMAVSTSSASAPWSGTVQIDGGGSSFGLPMSGNAIFLASGAKIIMKNMELRASAPDTSGTWALFPLGVQRAEGAKVILQDIVYRISCDQLVQFQIQLCSTASLLPNVEIRRETIRFRQYSYTSVSATNVTLVCSGTRPILEAVKVTCASAVAETTSTFESALMEIGLNNPAYISSTIWVANNVSFKDSALTAAGFTFNISNKLTLAAYPGLPYRPEVDFNQRPGIFFFSGQTSGAVVDGLKLVNMPIGPAGSYPFSLPTAMCWPWHFARRIVGSKAKRLVVKNTTLVVSDAEAAYWSYWMNMAPTSDIGVSDSTWDTGLWSADHLVVQPITPSRVLFDHVNGQFGQWDFYNVEIVPWSATTTVARRIPAVEGLYRYGLPGEPQMLPFMNVLGMSPLMTTSDMLVDSDPWYSYRSAHRVAVSNLEASLSAFAASTPVLSQPMLILGDPVQPLDRYLDLHGLSMAVTVSKSGRMNLRDMVIANAGVFGGVAALQQLGTANADSSDVTSGPSSGDPASLQAVAGNMTSLLWFWNFPRSLDAPVSYLNLTNVTLLVPDVEGRVLVNLTLGGANTTDVALEPALQALLVTAVGRMQAVPSSWPPNGVTFPSFSWFGITGQNVTIAPVPAYTIKGIDLPFSVEVPRWLPWMAADSAGLATPLAPPIASPSPPPPSPSPSPSPPMLDPTNLPGYVVVADTTDSSQQQRTVLIAAGVSAVSAVLLTIVGVFVLRKRCMRAGAWGKSHNEVSNDGSDDPKSAKPTVWVSNRAAGPSRGSGRGSGAAGLPMPIPRHPSTSTIASSAAPGTSSADSSADGGDMVVVPHNMSRGDAYADLSADTTSIIDSIVAKMAANNFNGLSAATPAGLQAVSRVAAQGANAPGAAKPKPAPAPKPVPEDAALTGSENLLLRDPREEMRRTLEVIQMGSGEFQVEIHSEIGKGACGVVYRGVWRGLEVAIKRLVIQLLKGPQGDASRQLAMREAAINASLSHANIVATYSYGMCPLGQGGQEEQDGSSSPTNTLGRGAIIDYHMYLIQEYCDKGSLYDAIRQKRLWNAEAAAPELYEAVRVMMDVAQGMAYLHSKQIVHADLKPDNILLKSASPPASLDYNASSTSVPPQLPQAPAVVAKVADFGMSIKMQGNQTHVSGVRHGTPLYIAPEVLHDSRVSKAADAYSFGVILWECWKGCSAWTELMRLAQDTPMLRGIAYYPGLFTFEPQPQPDTPGYHFVKLAEACLSLEASQRPSFNTIINRLQFVAYMLETGSPAPETKVPEDAPAPAASD